MDYKGKKGKHSDWVKGEGLETICAWVRHGLTDMQIIKNIGIGRTTFYAWLREYPNFAAEIKKARIQPNIEIENAMFDLACGRAYTEDIKTLVDAKTGEVLKIEKIRKKFRPIR